MGMFDLCFGKAHVVTEEELKSREVRKGASIGPFYFGKLLGQGAFGTVKEAMHNKTKESYAIKIIDKRALKHQQKIAIETEISILQELNHPNIIKLYKVYDEPTKYYLVTELMGGGELFDRIVRKRTYNEKEARDVCKILFEAINYCHENNVAHRDLKPNNLLLTSKNDDMNIKIADFGFAKKVTSSECLHTKCGSMRYIAPEILKGYAYGTQVDMWSLGVIIYTLLGGNPPFYCRSRQSRQELFRKIKLADYEFPSKCWNSISLEAKDMITKLLTLDPSHRMNAKEALESPWMLGEDLESYDLSGNLDKFRKFNAKRKLRQAVLGLIAAKKMEHFIGVSDDLTFECDTQMKHCEYTGESYYFSMPCLLY